MRTLAATEARANIYQLIEDVAEHHEIIQITSKRGNAVLISQTDWNTIQETLHLLSIPGMRESIQKGLKSFYETGSTKGIQSKHQVRLKIMLQHLDAANRPKDMNLPGMQWHPLKGKMKGFYAVSVNGNWRVIYKFEGIHAVLVDYLDYH